MGNSGEAKESFDVGPTAIDDPEIDPEQIMRGIREQILGTSTKHFNGERSYLASKRATYPDKPDDITYDLDLYHHLDRVNQGWSQIGTTIELEEGAFSRLPLLGNLWRMLRLKLHGPALFYANRVAEQQKAVNEEMVEILNQLQAANQEQQREINALREELNRL